MKLKFREWRWRLLLVTLAVSGYSLSQLWLGPKVTGFVVAREDLTQTIVAQGKIQAAEPVVMVSPFAGRVASIPLAEGQLVKQGDTVLVLELKDERAQLEKARAAIQQAAARLQKIRELTQAGSEQSLKKAQATLNHAKKQYAKANELSQRGYVSSGQLSEALRNLAIAQSQLRTAQFQARASRGKGSDYALAETALNRARAAEQALREKIAGKTLKAEVSGTLLARHVEAGSTVVPGQSLLAISPAGRMHAVVQLEAITGRTLHSGQQALIASDAYPGQSLPAEFESLAPATDTASGWMAAKFRLPAAADNLKQDMAVSLAIEVARRADTLSLPLAAICDADGAEPSVMLVNAGLAQRRRVKLGLRTSEKIEILEGLREGEQVLPAAEAGLQEGRRIRVAESGTVAQ